MRFSLSRLGMTWGKIGYQRGKVRRLATVLPSTLFDREHLG